MGDMCQCSWRVHTVLSVKIGIQHNEKGKRCASDVLNERVLQHRVPLDAPFIKPQRKELSPPNASHMTDRRTCCDWKWYFKSFHCRRHFSSKLWYTSFNSCMHFLYCRSEGCMNFFIAAGFSLRQIPLVWRTKGTQGECGDYFLRNVFTSSQQEKDLRITLFMQLRQRGTQHLLEKKIPAY